MQEMMKILLCDGLAFDDEHHLHILDRGEQPPSHIAETLFKKF